MIQSWLNSKFSNRQRKSLLMEKHFVLGTPLDAPLTENQDSIIFACGCFWGTEKAFWKLPGVFCTAVGYSGGNLKNPTYNQVCSGRSGHTEVVKVSWDKSDIDLSDLLKLFWECHDPTQGNRQGNDIGSQYRSAIYTSSPQQTELAISSRDNYQRLLTSNNLGIITTEIKENEPFFYAEKYHQQYLAKPGSRPYCSAMPTNISLGHFNGANYKLPDKVWTEFNWSESHCVLRSDINKIKI